MLHTVAALFVSTGTTIPSTQAACLCDSDCPPHSEWRLFIRKKKEKLPLLNLNTSIINSQHHEILKARLRWCVRNKNIFTGK